MKIDLMKSYQLLIDLDDYHFRNPENCLGVIESIVKVIPNFKVLLFTVPRLGGIPIYDDKDFCDRTRKLIESENVYLGIHGLDHSTLEFRHKSTSDAHSCIIAAEGIMLRAGLPFIRVFKGPNWGINKETVQILKQLDYIAIYNHEDFSHLEVEGLDFIYYNWNLKYDFPENESLILGHGHTHNVCGNGILETYQKILVANQTKSINFISPQEFRRLYTSNKKQV